ncbi:TetR/AcrR family transcriptional regulator [Rhodococcus sovatensis]|uniref:TetR/AcrR family transcriptional regulator n=1 Tax=Rhodococcus sovatensis TaxID=1805840 RepID=A0ABZ2PL74_9NOCA
MNGADGPTKLANRDKILDAAISAFASDPDATVEYIAQSAGVVRRTVYGHFPTRHDLIVGIVERAARDFVAALPVIDDLPSRPEVALALLELSSWSVADRYRALLGVGRRELGEQQILEVLSVSRRVILLVLERGRASGVFTDRMAAETVISVSEAATLALLDRANGGDDTITAATAAEVALSLAGVDRGIRQSAIDEATAHRATIESAKKAQSTIS